MPGHMGLNWRHVCAQREVKRNWFNLSAQEIQPLYYHLELEGEGWLRTRGCPEDAWNGGCSLLLDGFIPATHTSPVCAKCVCFLFTLLFQVGRKRGSCHHSLPLHTSLTDHVKCGSCFLCSVFQDLLLQCFLGIQDSADPHL